MASIGIIAVGVFGWSHGVLLPGDVGVTLGVAPNPYNTLNEELNAKQAQIDAEQANLQAQEVALASTSASTTAAASPTFNYLVIAVGVLALLVGLNFYFDWRRSRGVKQLPPTPGQGGPPSGQS